ncbi:MULTISPECIES: hypothetical protein [Calothrix]|uniref:Uncharacterized protein n=2 Tax=Calothrix TaxID=1186 RepID=A0ABR8AIP8_9CYAN|nr:MULTISPECIES: hypothetical protein [Calothrix]MBD2198457.1 hypothetical protein [Calothrix parietina FACHB-288]MBD2226859.1 hypothetical protein [Calothrix anomala FACHB-343]
MKVVKKLLAICFLLFGIPFSTMAVVDILNPQTTPKDKSDAIAALTILTLPSTAIGGWLIWSLAQQKRKEQALILEAEQKRISLIFLELVDNNAGSITVFQLARNAEISIKDAKQYLDDKAKEPNATFEVNEEGNMLYRFSL